jgi:uncharacterized iron-regulated membrane protein
MATTEAPPLEELAADEQQEQAGAASPDERRTKKVSLVRRISMRPRRVLVKAHRWLSFFLLAWVAIIAITGAWLVFDDAYEGWLHPERYDTTDGDVGIDAAIESVEAELPEDGYIANATLPTNGRGVYQIDAAWPDEGAPPIIEDGEEHPAEIYQSYFVDPGTGDINDTKNDAVGFSWWMYRGHMHLWQDNGPFNVFHQQSGWCRAGADGHEPGGVHGVVCDVIPDSYDLVGWLGVLWIIVLLTGFYLWFWPGVRRWTNTYIVQRGRGPFAFNLSLHKVIGFWFWVPLLIIGFTGIAFAFPNMNSWFENATPAQRDFYLWEHPEDMTPSEPEEGAEPLTAQEFLDVAEERYPERRVNNFYGFPVEGEPGTWEAWVTRGYDPWTREDIAGNTLLIVDAHTGETLYDGLPSEGNSFDQAWDDWSFPLHTGDFGGTTTRVLWTLAAIAPLVLGVTGTIMWITRYRKRRRAKTRAASRAAAAAGEPAPAPASTG